MKEEHLNVFSISLSVYSFVALYLGAIIATIASIASFAIKPNHQAPHN